MPTRLRFSRTARLTRSSEFARVKETGRSEHGRYMVCSVVRVEPQELTRIGLITSRRVGGAVTRNGIRRRLREIVRVDRPLLVAGRWIVLIARARAAEATFTELREEWRRLAKRAGLLVLDT